MFTHHVATLILLSASWITNMVRIGSLVLIVHDTVDWLLEISKLTNYAKWERLCEFCFVCFASVWFASRLVYFPLVVIKSCLFEATATLEEQGIDTNIDVIGEYFVVVSIKMEIILPTNKEKYLYPKEIVSDWGFAKISDEVRF